MTTRVALANVRVPTTREDSVALAIATVAEAGQRGAAVVCFSECFIPGYRWPGAVMPPPDAAFLERAWADVAAAAKAACITVILGTERVTPRGLQISALVINSDGSIAGWQDKVQLDPGEETTYPSFATERHVFTAGPLTFGVVICHEGFRYPETVRWAAVRGAKIVFHPQYTGSDLAGPTLTTWGAADAPYYEQAMMMRSRENTIYFASVNYATRFQESATSLIAPSGECVAHQPYGVEGVLAYDIDVEQSTGLLASRFAPQRYEEQR